MLVGGFSGLGIHSLLTVMKLFPRYFANVVFMSVGVVDSATFQGIEEVDSVREETEDALKKYVELARADGHSRRLPHVDGHRGGQRVRAARERGGARSTSAASSSPGS